MAVLRYTFTLRTFDAEADDLFIFIFVDFIIVQSLFSFGIMSKTATADRVQNLQWHGEQNRVKTTENIKNDQMLTFFFTRLFHYFYKAQYFCLVWNSKRINYSIIQDMVSFYCSFQGSMSTTMKKRNCRQEDDCIITPCSGNE